MTKCSKYKDCITLFIDTLFKYAGKISFLPNFIVRLYLAEIFFNSGMAKLDDWSGTLFLFQYEYHVPLFNHILAAYMAVILELCCPVLLVLGFATRFASLALFGMAIIINLSYVEAAENYYWMLLFSLLVVYGGDKLSLDYWIREKWFKKYYTHKNSNSKTKTK